MRERSRMEEYGNLAKTRGFGDGKEWGTPVGGMNVNGDAWDKKWRIGRAF